jgi:tripartite-type tricarboxylate transporter receptor subunit TctC
MKRTLAVFLLALGAIQAPAHSAYPEKPIKLIVPYAPGATTDTSARLFARYLEARLGQPLVVENKPGAAATAGTAEALRSAPDGYTLLAVVSGHPLASFAVKTTYDPIKDIQPLSLMINSPLVLVVHPGVPAKDIKELLAYGRANSGKLNYATTGGGEPWFLFEMLNREGSAGMVHVPYKGGTDAVNGVLRGDAHLMFTNYFQGTQFERDGRMRIIAVSTRQRAKALPAVPTLVESGFAKAIGNNYAGMGTVRGVPADIVNRLSRELIAISKDPSFVAAIEKLGFESVGSTPQEFLEVMQAQVETWTPIAKSLGIKPE